MIPNHKQRDVQTSGLDEQAVFGIAVNEQAHIMGILRDTLYTDKILAVLREYSANAWDSHKMNGKDDVPIKVTLPTATEPTLSIRDFGPGMSQEEIFTVFTQYGASTKRTTDKAVGTLGIGSKSGFAYSDSFTIDSYNGGMKSTYVALLDKSEKGLITLLNREPCGEETGIDIQIPVKPADIPLFIDKAKGLFRYFIPKPIINTEIASMAEVTQKMKTGLITNSGGWVAVMGCIPYRINIEQLQAIRKNEEEALNIRSFLSKMNGLLFFRIGEVQIVANREELRYSDETKAALVTRFNDLIEEFVTSALKDVQDSGLTQFERRMRLGAFSTLKFAIPEVLREFLNPTVEVKDLKEFSFWKEDPWSNKKPLQQAERFDISPELCFVLKDDSRAFSGFKLPQGRPFIVKLKAKKYSDWPKLMPKFEQFLRDMRIDGVRVIKLSETAWEQPPRKNYQRDFNEKHKVSTFRYSLTAKGYESADDWVIEKRTPQDTDVFVILTKFKTYKKGAYKPQKYLFHQSYAQMKARVELFGETMPFIYGYKSTKLKPVDESKLNGTEYLEWCSTKTKELLDKALTSPKVLEAMEALAWEELEDDFYSKTYSTKIASKANVEEVVKVLGVRHPLTNVVQSFGEAELLKKESYNTYAVIEEIVGKSAALSKMKKKAEKKFKEMLVKARSKYPLLESAEGGLSNLLKPNAKHWFQYVKMIDKETRDDRTTVHPHQRVPDSCVQRQDVHSSQLPAELREAPQGPVGQGLGQPPEVPDGGESLGGVGPG